MALFDCNEWFGCTFLFFPNMLDAAENSGWIHRKAVAPVKSVGHYYAPPLCYKLLLLCLRRKRWVVQLQMTRWRGCACYDGHLILFHICATPILFVLPYYLCCSHIFVIPYCAAAQCPTVSSLVLCMCAIQSSLSDIFWSFHNIDNQDKNGVIMKSIQ